jgi:AcrR family transcriptional regulator
VARTVDIATHSVRREGFVTAAGQLFGSKGYEATTIQDILDALGASRGAFYHYFGSKADLLDGVVEQMVDEALRSVGPSLGDPALTALQRLEALVDGVAAWKTEHAELALAVAEAWLSDQNALVRDRLRRALAERLTPPLAEVIESGVQEGVFRSATPRETAQVAVALLYELNLRGTELYLARRADTIAFEDVVRAFHAYFDAFDRILGAAPGSFPRQSDAVLRRWFDRPGEERIA